ncbi:hypothetical protein B0I37DRAFT_411629 [Chaetomium sp. MPI-CAGE-AT-0009]|nr:hypothetical protein B0I37DRAFT_411629 [Chaetomium sp. MPI-CAGE-AT-0009]
MVKLDYDRDYYADLELSSTADAVEVKKQFKKLALKFHPDRNPGKEDEAKEKFLVIQTAHEILADPVTKSKFDAYRQRTSRYPGPSGVRGNPWQNAANEVNQKYGAPPRRPNMPTRPPAPTAAQHAKPWDWVNKARTKADNTRPNMEAWDRARPQSKPTQPGPTAAGASARPPRPPPREPPTPRTASQARRQEAAFGRKTGYAPGSPMGDEPPVRNQHYNHPSVNVPQAQAQTSKPRPTSAYVDPLSSQFGDTFLDNRQRTPYAANVGEKTNPFEPLNVNRAKSMRDGARRFQDGSQDTPPPPPHRQRSASTGSENLKRSANENPSPSEPSANPGFQYQSRASARYSPGGPGMSSAPPTATFPGPSSSTSSVSSSANATVNGYASDQTKNGTKVYESPFSINPRNLYTIYSAGSSPQTPRSSGRAGVGAAPPSKFDFPAYKSGNNVGPTPSGERPSPVANAFERTLQAQLQQLLLAAGSPAQTAMPPKRNESRTSQYTNGVYPNSFSVPGDDSNATAHQTRFTRNSADNINTRFVAEEKGVPNFQFSAGSADDGFTRAKQRARAGQQSPLRNEFTASAEAVNGAQQAEAAKKQGDFVPEEWKEAFGPHVFVPPQPGKPSTSPTRSVRPIKKPRPVRMTAGTAGMVEEEDTSGEDKGKASSTPPSGINGAKSPNAMDIDTPPPEPADGQANIPRNINVEPTKPEWRPGNGATAEPKHGTGHKAPKLTPTSAGSEDAEDFGRPVFSEFRNVEPFAPPKPSGLGSFADLGSNLPFPSRPSTKIPLANQHVHPHQAEKPAAKHLDIPTPPSAPRAPQSLCIPGAKVGAPAWLTYVKEFEAYMALWFEFNRRVTDHFAARQRQNEGNGLAWLNTVGDGGVAEYLKAVEVDKYVRQKWMAACEAHELHFREFLGVRERVLAGN